VAREQGDVAGSRQSYEGALSVFRKVGDRWGIARSLTDLGFIACEQKDYAQAQKAYRESLDIFATLGHKRGIARGLEGLACLALAKGDPRQALSVAAAGAHLRKKISAPLPPAEQSTLDQRLRPAWETLGKSAGEKAWEEGWDMPVETAIRRVLDDRALDDQQTSTSS